MSKRKHNIAYIKPNEPTFLRQMKEQIGYKEGPDVNTKRERLHSDSGSDIDDREEEKPTVVVLKSGDMTAEEAEAFHKKKEEEEANAPADLTKKIVFNKPMKSKLSAADKSLEEVLDNVNKKHKTEENKKPKKSKQKAVLSFNDDEEEDEC